MMMNMYNRGSEYTTALFINLYRTYYRKEYKTVRRFKHISYDDLITLAKLEDERADLGDVLCDTEEALIGDFQ